MDPHDQFCHKPDCSDRGQRELGNIRIHSRKEQRYCCSSCGRTFAATTGTPFYRLGTATDMVTVVLTLLCHGCPLQAIVAAFGFDERRVAQWQEALITALVQQVRACARSLAILVCVDGLASYVTAFLRVFRYPVRTGRRGRPRLVTEPGLLIGQVIKRYARRCVVKVVHRVVRGTAAAVALVLKATGGTVINTAYIERLNATFRSALAPQVAPRTRPWPTPRRC